MEDMYHSWKADPESVHVSWRSVFARMDAGALPGQSFVPPPSLNAGQSLQASAVPAGGVSLSQAGQEEVTKVMQLINAYQARGHNVAALDPLGMYDADLDGSIPPDLELDNYGPRRRTSTRYQLTGLMQSGFLSGQVRSSREQAAAASGSSHHPPCHHPPCLLLTHTHSPPSLFFCPFCCQTGPMKLGEIINRLKQIYTEHIGVEYMHIWDHEQVNWIREQIETKDSVVFTKEEKLRMLDRLCWSDHFEAFLAKKYATAKRFGLEGCETLIVGMKELIDKTCDEGCENVVLGMPHRGRLNVLANVVRKPMEQIFSEFAGTASPDPEHDFSGSGDVKYHLGMSYTRPTISGGKVHLSLVANPSHRGGQSGRRGQNARQAALPWRHRPLKVHVGPLHGDAAFSGQGVVFETMGLSDLHDYTTGGTVHIVVNNQIGFTTDPRSSRSSHTAPMLQGDPGADLPRQRRRHRGGRARLPFGGHVAPALPPRRRHRHVCYRKFGHKWATDVHTASDVHLDRPHDARVQKYSAQLIAEGIITQEEVNARSGSF